MDPCLLALDTATELMAVGLCSPAGQATRQEAGGAQSSARLIPLAQGLLADAGLTWAALDAIAFSAGPGAFTGLRTACAVAQGLGLGLNKPLIAIDSLMTLAEDAWGQVASTQAWYWVAQDARMDEVYAAAYQRHSGDKPGWTMAEAPALCTLAALAARWAEQPPRYLAGNAATVFAKRLPCASAVRVDVVNDRAGAALRLARQAWADGLLIAADDALPVYLRDKVALTTVQRQQQARAGLGVA